MIIRMMRESLQFLPEIVFANVEWPALVAGKRKMRVIVLVHVDVTVTLWTVRKLPRMGGPVITIEIEYSTNRGSLTHAASP